MTLRLVPKSTPTPAQAVKQRIKKMPKLDGALQCNRCGSRTSASVQNGAVIKNGRIQGGTDLLKHVCADCYKQGVVQFMLPELERIK